MAEQWHGGKGDKDRVDMKKYRDNWDAIDWSKGKETPDEKNLSETDTEKD